MLASCMKLVWVLAWLGLTCTGQAVSALRTVQVEPGSEQLFADAVADFGSTGEDTVILLPQGKTVSLVNITIKNAQPAPGYTPFSSGTLIIRPGPGDSPTPTILDAGMRQHIASYQGQVKPFSQAAKLLVYNLTIINNCDYTNLLDENNRILTIDTGLSPSFILSGTVYQAFQFYNCTMYVRQGDLTSWTTIFYVLKSPFPQISAYSTYLAVASLPGIVYYNTSVKSTANPADPLLQSLRVAGTLMPHQYCGQSSPSKPLPPIMLNPLAPTWLTSDTAGWLDALNQATNNFYIGTALGAPMTVILTGTAIPAACPSPPIIAALTRTLVLSGPALNGRYSTDGVLDLEGVTAPILPVAVEGQLFLQYLRLRNLPTQPLPTSGAPSVFPLSSFPLSNSNATNSPSSFIQMHNVTLELPDLDYLALLALAQPDLITQINTTVQAHATALKAGITTFAVSSVLPGLLGMEVSAFTGWGLNITILYVLPSQRTAPVSLALSMAASSQATILAAAQAGDPSKQYTGAQLGGAVAGAVLGSLLLGAALAWLLMAAGCIGPPTCRATTLQPQGRSESSLPQARAQRCSTDGSTESSILPVLTQDSRTTQTPNPELKQTPTHADSQPSSAPQDMDGHGKTQPPAMALAAAECEDAVGSLLEVLSHLSQQPHSRLSNGRGKLHSSDLRALEDFCSDHTSMQVSKVVAPAATPNDDPSLEQITLMLSAGTKSSLNPGLVQGHHTMTQSAQPTPPQQPTSGAGSAASVTIMLADEAGNATVPGMPVTQSSGYDSAGASTASQVVAGRSTDVSSKGSGTSSTAFKAAVGQLVEELQRDMNKVAVDGVLGQGGGGIVYSGRWRGLDVALKTMVLEAHDLSNTAVAQAGAATKHGRAALEVAVAASVDHPNVVRTYYYDIQEVKPAQGKAQHGLEIDESQTQEGATVAYKIFLIQERCTTSLVAVLDMEKLHDMHGTPLQSMGLVLLLDIAQGLEYLHGRNIVHGDLKPANVLLAPSTNGDGVIAKLADFGLSARLSMGATHVSNYRSGTPFYVAPEVVQEHRTSPASDIFSFGVIMWQVHTGQSPYTGTDNGTFAWNPLFPGYSQDNPPSQVYATIVHRCLLRDPKERPCASDLVWALKNLIEHTEVNATSALARSQG